MFLLTNQVKKSPHFLRDSKNGKLLIFLGLSIFLSFLSTDLDFMLKISIKDMFKGFIKSNLTNDTPKRMNSWVVFLKGRGK